MTPRHDDDIARALRSEMPKPAMREVNEAPFRNKSPMSSSTGEYTPRNRSARHHMIFSSTLRFLESFEMLVGKPKDAGVQRSRLCSVRSDL